ncbi:MAG: Na/Pi cotransporter family protein [bacterium]|nr:Na/Pi cotransporter family protein [bacterium]
MIILTTLGIEGIMTVLGGLGLFLYGMKIMSESLQNATGEGLRNILWKATNNRIKGVITGFTITGIIQSSSATTVMLVSFVNAGLINVLQATGIILGANIGTTVTAWLVSIIGFKFKMKALALPAIAIGFFIRFIKNEKVKYWGEVLVGFGILFLGLSLMSDTVKVLKDVEEIKILMASYKADTIFSTIMAVLVGAGVTMLIQSSSATMAVTMVLAQGGLIDFATACALILGENIGTTITANLAAIGSSIAARRAAVVHMLFNTFGVIWALIALRFFFLDFIDFIIPGDPNSTAAVTAQPGEAAPQAAITDHMAAFHTVFNIANMLIFLPFVKFLAATAERIVPDRGKTDEDAFHLKFISTSLLATPSMNINQARLEIKRMMGITSEMFEMVMNVFDKPEAKLGDVVEKIQVMENHTDLLEKEISNFLVKVVQDNISEEQSHEVSLMLQRVNELESIADQCESLLKLMRRKYDEKIEFTESAAQQIDEIAGKVSEFLILISRNITSSSTNIIVQAETIENRINELRKEMRKNHITRLNEGTCDVPTGLIFIDMLTSFEKIGDHAFNIAEGISGLRIF